MNTENIISIFKDYLKSDTNQALLINGEWGSIKTFFWKNTLSKTAFDEQLKDIYISLNGIATIENLEHILFFKLIPFISNQENKTIKNITKFSTTVLDKISSHYLKFGLKELFKDISVDGFNFKNYIICFDDLERCQIPIKEVFGFINNFVEHKKLKTIILADEKEIEDEKNQEKGYKNIKEKLVGRILQYQPEIDKTILIFFDKYKNDTSFLEFLNQQKEYIISLLKEYKVQNLRTVSFYLDALKQLFPLFENEKENRKKEIILFSLIISILVVHY